MIINFKWTDFLNLIRLDFTVWSGYSILFVQPSDFVHPCPSCSQLIDRTFTIFIYLYSKFWFVLLSLIVNYFFNYPNQLKFLLQHSPPSNIVIFLVIIFRLTFYLSLKFPYFPLRSNLPHYSKSSHGRGTQMVNYRKTNEIINATLRKPKKKKMLERSSRLGYKRTTSTRHHGGKKITACFSDVLFFG